MLTDALNPPEIIDRLDPVVLSDLQDAFPDQRLRLEWYREANERHGSNQKLLEALQPLHEIVLDNEARHFRGVPWGVYYAIDTQPVLCGGTQRPPGWHVDGEGRGRSLVVADALPTEFLIKTPDVSRYASLNFLAPRLELLHRVRNSSFCYLPEEDIQRNNLSKYSPQPYEVAQMRGHIHCSPVNHSEETVVRAWVRAAILSRKYVN